MTAKTAPLLPRGEHEIGCYDDSRFINVYAAAAYEEISPQAMARKLIAICGSCPNRIPCFEWARDEKPQECVAGAVWWHDETKSERKRAA